ncbi:glucanase b [Sporothrix schenckii 1099-18]|uniref:Glucanase b n=1 Tax=Sporothrix schenckii 1099-18 TaxID=1397361 RepID=A0A0F2MKR7_SPOSC|nr:glucanase b [Sporothrix schenckii 1099-18]KJR88781.1 glucanase b [Sporothrix schenckii 1099-18]
MPDSLVLRLQNTSPDEVYAYVTGLDIKKNSRRVLVAADGHSLYYPVDPPAILQPLQADVAIPLGKNGAVTDVTIPQIAGGRIWFSRGSKKLTFLLNPSNNPVAGPALVEPSVLNPSDPNAAVDFSFCEFTLNSDQLFANISYVDFVGRLPIALTLQRQGGSKEVQHVSGMRAEAFATVCDQLRAQAKRDGKPWDKLIVMPPNAGPNDQPLRVLNPTHGDAVGGSFAGYYEPYVDQVWKQYAGGSKLSINTQTDLGVIDGTISNGQLVFDGEGFNKPTTDDILGCNSGPFTTGSSRVRNAIIPRLAAAFQRSTLLTDAIQPSANTQGFYTVDPTNHYCRIVHAANLDGKGYTFAYDDVQADGGADQSGKVNAGDPEMFMVSVGGYNVYTGDRLP